MTRYQIMFMTMITAANSGCSNPFGQLDAQELPPLAALTLYYKAGNPGTGTCGNLNGSFVLTPQPPLTGTEGIDHEVTRSFDEPGAAQGSFEQRYCGYRIQATEPGGLLKPGTWRIEIRTLIHTTSCSEHLAISNNSVYFTRGLAGCARN